MLGTGIYIGKNKKNREHQDQKKIKKIKFIEGKMYKLKVVGNGPSYCSNFFLFWWNLKNGAGWHGCMVL